MAKTGKSQQTARKSTGGGFLVGVVIGLVLGLGIALGVAFYLNKTPIPFGAKTKTGGRDSDVAKAPAIPGLPLITPSGNGAARPGTSDKPKFDFYKILPGGEEPVSDAQLKAAELARTAKIQPNNGKGVYFVQTGSFQNPADADNQKAKLAMLGFESGVVPTTLPDKGTWYRVRLGPYTQIDDINKVRQALAQSGMTASLIKLKDPKHPKAN